MMARVCATISRCRPSQIPLPQYISIHKRRLVGIALVLVILTIVAVYKFHQWEQEQSIEKIGLPKDLTFQEPWPEIENAEGFSQPEKKRVSTVHYIWCGKKQFQFQHYLGILSALRLLRPDRIVFHYTHLPAIDYEWYHTWFQELKQSYGNLELEPLQTSYGCGSVQLLDQALDFLSLTGGVFLGENVILTRFPHDVNSRQFWHAFAKDSSSDVTQGVAFAGSGFNPAMKGEWLRAILSSRRGTAVTCSDVTSYDALGPVGGAPCVVVRHKVFPRDVWLPATPFAQLARWLYYGQRKVLQVQKSNSSLIPRVGHIVLLSEPTGELKPYHFNFLNFLSVLSALHVAGLDRVYAHGDLEPQTRWWRELKLREKVTFVTLDSPKTIFQNRIQNVKHRGDIVRIQTVEKYGGVYHDTDVLWINRIPDWLLQYQTVVCRDILDFADWHGAFNNGVLLSRAHAPWLRHYSSTFRHFLDHIFGFNGLKLSYRTYEHHPETVYIDTYLQSPCLKGKCHPKWTPDGQRRDLAERETVPTSGFPGWRQARAFHILYPKDLPSVVSPQGLAAGTDLFAEIGKDILKKAGREDILKIDNH